jgi:hypothetical protein
MTQALDVNSMAMAEFKVSTKDFRETVLRDHTRLQNDIDQIKSVSYGYQDWLNSKKKVP